MTTYVIAYAEMPAVVYINVCNIYVDWHAHKLVSRPQLAYFQSDSRNKRDNVT